MGPLDLLDPSVIAAGCRRPANSNAKISKNSISRSCPKNCYIALRTYAFEHTLTQDAGVSLLAYFCSLPVRPSVFVLSLFCKSRFFILFSLFLQGTIASDDSLQCTCISLILLLLTLPYFAVTEHSVEVAALSYRISKSFPCLTEQAKSYIYLKTMNEQ